MVTIAMSWLPMYAIDIDVAIRCHLFLCSDSLHCFTSILFMKLEHNFGPFPDREVVDSLLQCVGLVKVNLLGFFIDLLRHNLSYIG